VALRGDRAGAGVIGAGFTGRVAAVPRCGGLRGWPGRGCLIGAEGYMDLNHGPLPCQGVGISARVAASPL
jgi:hypothetical protein